MATLEDCRAALTALAAKLDVNSATGGKSQHLDRTISCSVPDLGVTFSGRLADGRVGEMSTDPAPRAQIRLTAQSDDLVELSAGSLPFAGAWSSGRLKVEANVFDLLKLRSLL